MAHKRKSGWAAMKSEYPTSRSVDKALKRKQSAGYRKVLRSLKRYHQKRGL